MNCQEFNRIIDSYLSDELLVETNHDVLRHLENCRDCRDQTSAHRELRTRLRDVVRGTPEMMIDGAFATRLRVHLCQTALSPGIFEKLTAFGGLRLGAAFACVALVVIGALFLLKPQPNETANVVANISVTQDGVIQANKTRIVEAVRVAWVSLSEQAIDDHKNCAVQFNLAEKPISLDEAAVRFGAYNKDLDKPVAAALKKTFPGKGPDRVELLEAHHCIRDGRGFTHIVLRQKGHKISVLVTDTDLPTDVDNIDEFHADGTMHTTGFRVGRHAVFVVSELSEAENAVIAHAIEPVIRRHIESAGA